MGKTTNGLIELSQGICPDPDKRAMDMLLATGEQVSIALLSMALIARGCPAVALTGWQAGILTEDSHMNSRIRCVDTARLQRSWMRNVVVVAGFQGVTQDDRSPPRAGLGHHGGGAGGGPWAGRARFIPTWRASTTSTRACTRGKKLDEISHSETSSCPA